VLTARPRDEVRRGTTGAHPTSTVLMPGIEAMSARRAEILDGLGR
jgi:hypothetical protein